MKNIRYYLMAFLSLAALSLTSCSPKEDMVTVSKAVLASANKLTFAGKGADPQMIIIYSDGDWSIKDEIPAWITVEPISGRGQTEVTISVTDNVREGALDKIRKVTLVFKGNTKASEAPVEILQNGNKFRDVEDYTITTASQKEDGTIIIVPSSQVVARTAEGIMVSDGTTNMFAICDTTKIAVGSKVKIMGDKGTQNAIAIFSAVDTIRVTEAGSVTYPEPKVVSNFDTYSSDKAEFIQVEGLLSGNKIEAGSIVGKEFVVDKTKAISISLISPDGSLGLKGLDGHVVSVNGYYAGTAKPVLYVIAAEVADKGEFLAPLGVLYYYDSFTGNTNKAKIVNGYVKSMTGWATANSDYTAGTNVDFRNTYKQGSGNYVDYTNALWPEFKSTPGMHLYVATGTYDAAQSWFQINNIALSSDVTTLQLGMGVFGVDPNEAWVAKPSTETFDIWYAFDTDEFTYLKENSGFNYNWQWMNFPRIKVKTGAKVISFKILPSNANCVRFDDMTLVGDGSEGHVEAKSFIKISTDKPVEAPADGGDFDIVVKANVEPEFSQTLASHSWLTMKGMTQKDEEYTVTFTATKNDTEAERITTVKFFNVKKGVADSIDVKQAVSKDSKLQLTSSDVFSLAKAGGDFTVKFKTNTSFKYSGMPGWINLKGSPTQTDDEVSVVLTAAANTDKEVRTAKVRLFTEDEKMDTVVYVTQAPTMPAGENVLFADDFSWLQPYIDAAKAAGTPLGDAVGLKNIDSNAPNAYDKVAGMMDEFARQGYVDLNPGPKVVYPQDAYLKFGKTSNHTGIRIPALTKLDAAANVKLTFNYCAHYTGGGVIDPVVLYVDVAEAGNVVTKAGKATTSDPITMSQDPNNTRDLFWQTATIELTGITSASKISIHPTPVGAESGAKKRWYIDNIIVEKQAGPAVFFEENFDWLEPLYTAYNKTDAAKDNPVTDEVGTSTANAKAPQAQNVEGFTAKFEEIGYEQITNPAESYNMYMDMGYLKFGKTNNNSGIRLPAMTKIGTDGVSVTLGFDYAMYKTTTETVNLVVSIENAGKFVAGDFADAGATSSKNIKIETYWTWYHVDLKMTGVTSATRIKIMPSDVPTDNNGRHRWYIDNIKVSETL